MITKFKIFENQNTIPAIIDNPYLIECIRLAKSKGKVKDKKNDIQRYGALVVKNGEIIGRGYNRATAGKGFKLPRVVSQGAFNHAEVEALNDALMHDHDVDGADIYVAGYFTDTQLIYFKKEFTCLKCIPHLRRYGIRNIYVPTPDGWVRRPIEEAYEDGLLFKGKKKGDVLRNRRAVLIGEYPISMLKESVDYDYPFIYLADYEDKKDQLKSIILNRKISFDTYELNDRNTFEGDEFHMTGIVKDIIFGVYGQVSVILNGKKYLSFLIYKKKLK